MPKLVYICNYCGKSFANEMGAADCEKTHHLGEDFRVIAVSGYVRSWPEMIEVVDGTGETATYTLWVARAKKETGWLDDKGMPMVVAKSESRPEPSPDPDAAPEAKGS